MAKSLNKVTLIGNIGSEIEVKTSAGGMAYCNLSLATNERKKDSKGEWVDHTEWHRLVMFDKLADVTQRFLMKGSKIYVEGRIETTKYTDKKDNIERYATRIIVNDLIMLGGKSKGGDDVQESYAPAKPQTQSYQQPQYAHQQPQYSQPQQQQYRSNNPAIVRPQPVSDKPYVEEDDNEDVPF